LFFFTTLITLSRSGSWQFILAVVSSFCSTPTYSNASSRHHLCKVLSHRAFYDLPVVFCAAPIICSWQFRFAARSKCHTLHLRDVPIFVLVVQGHLFSIHET
jgi:hypothetical protein